MTDDRPPMVPGVQQAPPDYDQRLSAHPSQYPAPYPGHYPPPGARVAPFARRPKSRVVAGVLAIVLGAFGVHRFYLGYTGIGLTMLLMTVLSFGLLGLVTSVWGLVEGILYLSSTKGRYARDGNGRPLHS